MQLKILPHKNLVKKLPPEVKIIFKIFGDEIRLVGGCVRDLLLQKKVNDFDFATKFPPQKTAEILKKNKIKAIPTGIKFGTITAVVNGKNFEITTLRKDKETDGRHCNPEFIDDYFLDAKRRDFTINALYFDAAGLVYDYFDGISDLKKQKVRFIGDAKKRIEEDYLRILRFFRFSCKYSKRFDSIGLKACYDLRENLSKLSRERIRSEFLKIINCEKKDRVIATLNSMKKNNLFTQIFSRNLNILKLQRLFKIEKSFGISASLRLKLAIIFWKKDGDFKSFFNEICATNLEKKYFSNLSNLAGSNYEELMRLFLSFEKEVILDFYFISLCKKLNLSKIKEIKSDIKFLQKFSSPHFPLSGDEIKNLGFKSKEIGIAIKSAQDFWIKSNFKAGKKELINFLKK